MADFHRRRESAIFSRKSAVLSCEFSTGDRGRSHLPASAPASPEAYLVSPAPAAARAHLAPPVQVRASAARLVRGREGQSTVEFFFALLLMMSFSLFFIQISLMMAWGNYVQYATFMAARAYEAGGSTIDDQTQRAQGVGARMLRSSDGSKDRFAFFAQGTDGPGPGGASDVPGLNIGQGTGYKDADKSHSWIEGVRYTFKGRLFLLPFGNASAISPAPKANELELTSESWLSRDPTYQECSDWMTGRKWYYDNGC